MEQENTMLGNESIRQACIRALENPGQLQEVLEMIFRESFQDCKEMAPVFSERAMVMYDELQQQLAECRKDADAWLEKQIEKIKHNEKSAAVIMSGICAMAAAQHKESDEAAMNDLAVSLDVPCQADRISGMMNEYWNTPLQDLLFTWRSYPILNEAQQRSAACILAMLVYAEAKNDPKHELAADVSFDSICLLAGTVAEVKCRSEKDIHLERAAKKRLPTYSQMAASVCGLLCTQYLWLDSVKVCVGCIHSLVKGIGGFFDCLSRILQGVESVEEGHIEVEATTEIYDFDRTWGRFLQSEGKEDIRNVENVPRNKSNIHRRETDYE